MLDIARIACYNGDTTEGKERKKMKNIQIANVTIEPNGKDYSIYIDDCYIGTYKKTIVNTKLRSWKLPEVDFNKYEK